MRKLRRSIAKVAAATAVLAAPMLARADITISAPPDSAALINGLTSAYGAAVGLGLTCLGVGFIVYLLRKGVKTRA